MINRIINKLGNITQNIPLRGHFEFMFHSHKQTQLGRWGLLDDKRVNQRIDRSNTDNCGPCGYDAIDKNKLKDKLKNKNDLE
jgi:hypothetical protein